MLSSSANSQFSPGCLDLNFGLFDDVRAVRRRRGRNCSLLGPGIHLPLYSGHRVGRVGYRRTAPNIIPPPPVFALGSIVSISARAFLHGCWTIAVIRDKLAAFFSELLRPCATTTVPSAPQWLTASVVSSCGDLAHSTKSFPFLADPINWSARVCVACVGGVRRGNE